jgi:hypothetical protein
VSPHFGISDPTIARVQDFRVGDIFLKCDSLHVCLQDDGTWRGVNHRIFTYFLNEWGGMMVWPKRLTEICFDPVTVRFVHNPEITPAWGPNRTADDIAAQLAWCKERLAEGILVPVFPVKIEGLVPGTCLRARLLKEIQ